MGPMALCKGCVGYQMWLLTCINKPVRLGKRCALKLVRPVVFCVALSGSVRLQNVCKGRLTAPLAQILSPGWS
jgi:hypothetical protein